MGGRPEGCHRLRMLINILSVGSPKDTCIRELTEGYLERIRRYCPVALKAVKQEALVPGAAADALKKEAQKLISLMDGCYNMVLDKDGEGMNSESFANFLNKRIMSGVKVMNIIIGGPMGIDSSVKQRAEKTMALSRMTFPHELAMVIVAEQVYRAFAILHGLPYHK